MSANTKRLASLCKEVNNFTYHIENENDIQKDWLKGKNKIGIVTGASTPCEVVNRILFHIEKFFPKGGMV